ncbi:hypothetical protein SAMN05421752_12728 [Natronorubrum thiooxidans]|uniref:Uncharacterized protein n=1 Tax=Natronorubrum thiooxidans TaxID=308853 RepID=A0A1N7H636_9EURY|nr:hypothetical protein SAMN05421752_12728 [Natronorubrum thiooxidans]
MLFEFVRLESKQVLVAHFPVEIGVIDSSLEGFLERFGVGLAAPLVQQARSEVGLEVVVSDLPAVDQTKQDAIGEDGFEQVGQIERQRVAPFAGFVEVTDRRIECGCPDRRDAVGVD